MDKRTEKSHLSADIRKTLRETIFFCCRKTRMGMSHNRFCPITREKRTLTHLRVRHNCQSSLKPAQEHLIGSLTRNLTVFVFLPHTEKLTVCDKNSWSERLCFLTVTPFYEPITEVILLTCAVVQ